MDITAAFDKIPHHLLLHKLKSYGVRGTCFRLIKSYLTNRKIKIRVNGTYSENSPDDFINCGVPQGSILGPLLFLIYINDLPDNLSSVTFLYADDTSLYVPVDPKNPINAVTNLHNDVTLLSDWSNKWKLDFKPSKSALVTFAKTGKRDYVDFLLDHTPIPKYDSHKHLGFVLDNNLNFKDHVNHLVVKIQKLINPLKHLSRKLKSRHLNTIYCSFIAPHYDYGDVLYAAANIETLKQLDKLHYRAALLISGCIQGSNSAKVLRILNWQSLESRRTECQKIYMFKATKLTVPVYVMSIFDRYKPNIVTARNLRDIKPFRFPANYSSKFRSSPALRLMSTWNNLSTTLRNLQTLSQFKSKICHRFSADRIVSTTTIKNINRKEELCLNRLRVDLLLKSQLFSHNFPIISPNCQYCNTPETTKHFLLLCQKPNHLNELDILLNALDSLEMLTIFNQLSMINKCNFLLFGDKRFNIATNHNIILLTAKFILATHD